MPTPRKSVSVLKIEGSYRKDRHGNRVDVQVEGEPTKPKDLSPGAEAVWDTTVPLLIKAGMVAAIDTAMLTEYCNWKSLSEALLKACLADPKSIPKLRAARQASELAFQLSEKFGLNPVARLKLNGKPKQKSSAARFLK